MRLDYLYHWSPKRHRVTILRDGLKVMIGDRTCPCPETGEELPLQFPWICLGTTPWTAWNLIADPDAEYEKGGWDLWMVRVKDGDRVQVRSDLGLPVIQEVRVDHGLPADRLWWVGERMTYPHDTL